MPSYGASREAEKHQCLESFSTMLAVEVSSQASFGRQNLREQCVGAESASTNVDVLIG